MPKSRLDQLLVARGLAQSRERARALLLAGHVDVDGTRVDQGRHACRRRRRRSRMRQPDHPWVGRGGIKLAHALDVFHLDVTGITALDIGASTGGFTDVLLQRGAARVVALDVGHNQIDWRLRSDPRVVCLEGVNARYLRPEDLPDGLRAFALVTIDVSFISLAQILPVVPPLLAPGGRVVALVKPQFEAGRAEVGPGGIVRDPAIHARVIDEVTAAAVQVGLERVALTPSPVTGAEGNAEFLLLLRALSHDDTCGIARSRTIAPRRPHRATHAARRALRAGGSRRAPGLARVHAGRRRGQRAGRRPRVALDDGPARTARRAAWMSSSRLAATARCSMRRARSPTRPSTRRFWASTSATSAS